MTLKAEFVFKQKQSSKMLTRAYIGTNASERGGWCNISIFEKCPGPMVAFNFPGKHTMVEIVINHKPVQGMHPR